jgi:RNA polymerase sigma-70 factor, ECF subfamily
MKFSLKRQNTDFSDEQLVQRMVAGNAGAFEQLYHRYSERLLYYFYRMFGNSNEKAQDFLQDIFVKLIDNAEYFDSSRKFSTWIFSIAHNMCKNEYRRMDIRKNTDIEDYAHILAEEEPLPDESQVPDMEQFIKDLFEELESFDEIHKTAFLLHYREGFSIKDIGLVMEIPEGTVKSRLFYTRKQLSERLIKYRKICE